MLSTGGHLRWRILMILILLGVHRGSAAPSITPGCERNLAREAVQEELKRLVPSNAIVSQQVSIGKDRNRDSLDFDQPYP